MAKLEAVEVAYSVKGAAILGKMSVSFEPRSLTAVMGPSGAGKTSLLKTLAMRAPGQVSGSVLVNNVLMTRSTMRRQLSYMPQSDDLYGQLRIREVLEYAARFANASEERVSAIVDALGLRPVLDNMVSGVSGGQRRRTSAAIEFLSGRPLLLMDEPTSGLDSATAFALGNALGAAAHSENRTVIATIHQPSWALLTKFDALVVLAPGVGGAKIAFDGAPADLPAFFARANAAVPEGTNPADHLMRVLDDKWWHVEEKKKKKEEPTTTTTTIIARPSADDEAEYPITTFEQYRILVGRALRMWVVDPQQGPLIMKLQLVIMTVMILLLAGMPFNLSKANATFYYVITKLPMCMTPLVIILPQEKAVVLREYRNGVFAGPIYWLARFTLAVAQAAAISTTSTFYVYPLIDFPLVGSKMVEWWFLELMYVSCIMMLGLGLGIASPSPIAGNKVVVAVYIPWLVTSAVFPPLHMMRPTVSWLRFPNLFTWAVKLGLSIGFVHNGDKAMTTYRDVLGIHAGNADSCFQALAVAFVATFVFGLAATLKVLDAPDATAGARPSSSVSKTLPIDDKVQLVSSSATAKEDSPLDTAKVPLLTTPYGATDEESPTLSGVAVELRRVTYEYAGRVALDGASVRFPAGTVSVIMGPSGAGKTTLLGLLAGRLGKNLTKGTVLVDEAPAAGTRVFARIGTLTPQEFALPHVLTVRQTLAYTAELRGVPGSRVEALLDKLGLRPHANTVIGTNLKVGISGGQKKRVSIAMDLLAERPVMLVDEPTTGLDAFAALGVVELLVALEGKRTVVCTLHQPPWSTVCRFNKLVLLAGGRVLFADNPSALQETLATKGFPVPPNENPAEHVLAIIVAGNLYAVLVRRSAYTFLVDPDQFPELLMPTIIAGIFLGFSFRNFGVNVFLAAAVLCALTAHGMTVMSGIVLNIPTERPLVLREHRNGTYTATAYFCARTTVALACAIGISLPFFAVYYPLVGFSATSSALFNFWAASVLNAINFALIAGVIGLVCETPLASAQISEPIGNAMILFSGCIITKRFIKPYALPVYYGLPIGYAFEIALTSVLENKGDDGDDVLDYFDLHPNYRSHDYCVLALMGLFWLGLGIKVAHLKISSQDNDEPY
ncbi:hypothetical protein CTAYLR_003203 [Chrysophaeum taylorii]|uniref:ABC transporter domain-containing protein n=1 Tax=Chrysophaeum taylorii TaxID=2483200 RepID=A0AAD7XKQ0_9STRA|nr:hypothetical protein CTAYLR_003203 [Chrysophaeum taylorii]